MTNSTFEIALEAARDARLQFAEHTRQFKLAQAKLAEERDKLNITAIEAAKTFKELCLVLKCCTVDSLSMELVEKKLYEVMETIDRKEFYSVFRELKLDGYRWLHIFRETHNRLRKLHFAEMQAEIRQRLNL